MTTPEFRRHVPTCSGKAAYPSRDAAKRQLATIRTNFRRQVAFQRRRAETYRPRKPKDLGRLEPYRCRFCSAWHLGEPSAAQVAARGAGHDDD